MILVARCASPGPPKAGRDRQSRCYNWTHNKMPNLQRDAEVEAGVVTDRDASYDEETGDFLCAYGGLWI